MVEFVGWKAADLCVAGVFIKDVGKEFRGDGDAGNDEAVDVVAVHDEELFLLWVGCEFAGVCALGDAVEVDEEGDEDFVSGGAVFEDAGEVSFEANCGDVAAVKSQDVCSEFAAVCNVAVGWFGGGGSSGGSS